MNKKSIYCTIKKKSSIKKLEIKKSGFLSIKAKEQKYSKNLLSLQNSKIKIEIIKLKKVYFLKLLNHEKIIKNKKIFFPFFSIISPYYKITNIKIKLNSGDIINIKNTYYIVGSIQYKGKFDTIKCSELENTSEITLLHKFSLYKNLNEINKKCFLCEKDKSNLYIICNCKYIHINCFKKYFKEYRDIKLNGKNLEITYNNFFCEKCQKFYNWNYFENGHRKILIDFKEFKNYKKFLFLIKFNQLLSKQRKYVFVFIPILFVFQKFQKNFGIVQMEEIDNEDTYLVKLKKDVKLFSFKRKKHFYNTNFEIDFFQENLSLNFA